MSIKKFKCFVGYRVKEKLCVLWNMLKKKNMLLCIIVLKVEQYLNRVEQQSSELFSTLTLLFVYLMN